MQRCECFPLKIRNKEKLSFLPHLFDNIKEALARALRETKKGAGNKKKKESYLRNSSKKEEINISIANKNL